jgi:kinesin family member 15
VVTTLRIRCEKAYHWGIATEDDAMDLILRGAENRRVSETRMNRESSRSHSVFTCTLESTTRNASGITSIRFSRLNIIDLAGCSLALQHLEFVVL